MIPHRLLALKILCRKAALLNDGCLILDSFIDTPHIANSWESEALTSKPLNCDSHLSDHNVHRMWRAFQCRCILKYYWKKRCDRWGEEDYWAGSLSSFPGIYHKASLDAGAMSEEQPCINIHLRIFNYVGELLQVWSFQFLQYRGNHYLYPHAVTVTASKLAAYFHQADFGCCLRPHT